MPLKTHNPPPLSHRKIWVTPLEVAVKNGYPPLGCRKLVRAAGANRAKEASRAAGELRERDIFVLVRVSVSFFCVCKKWIPPPWSLRKILVPPLGNLVKNGYPP